MLVIPKSPERTGTYSSPGQSWSACQLGPAPFVCHASRNVETETYTQTGDCCGMLTPGSDRGWETCRKHPVHTQDTLATLPGSQPSQIGVAHGLGAAILRPHLV